MVEQAAYRTDQAEELGGATLIRNYLRTLPSGPGVYRMFDGKGQLLYVGKAKSLKKRVASYTKPQALTVRLQRMVALTRSMEFVTTTSEVEALLLESNLIKRHRPSFNIVLRDDKSFPYIALRLDHDFPMISKHRGAKRDRTEYFGPFASATAVNDTLNALLRAFPLRNCSDAIFSSRTRPCLQYQIKRCSAPCVDRISQDDYGELVKEVRGFLKGSTREVQERLQADMHAAAENLDFEKAAMLRDRLRGIAHVASRQGINTTSVEDADIIALHSEGGEACVQVFFYRGGRNYGNRAYFPAHTRDSDDADILSAFAAQFYAERTAPREVLLGSAVSDQELLAEALSSRGGHRVHLHIPQRGEKKQLVDIARHNAQQALARRMAEQASQAAVLAQLAERFDLAGPPGRIEVYDNSHIQGRHAVGAFIVAGRDGFDRKSYRTFTIKDADVEPGDDYGMMREVLRRRFSRLLRDDPDREHGTWPDLVLIDGGAGQLSSVEGVMNELGIVDQAIIGVAKGPNRDAGEERFFMKGHEPRSLNARDPVLYYLQRLRDEAHRFVINTHRGKRGKAMAVSALDQIAGIGGKRKKALLSHFGSVREIQGASLHDLEQVPGINKAVARAIHDHFHEQG
ncbi:MAG: excinuclease ABC subunit UvrC [Geminicoccaceae bacterium]|nr:excinuclease ABC subunit UvrC [Geminicoccaceae bacterium]